MNGAVQEKVVLDDPMSEMAIVEPIYYYCSIVYIW